MKEASYEFRMLLSILIRARVSLGPTDAKEEGCSDPFASLEDLVLKQNDR